MHTHPQAYTRAGKIVNILRERKKRQRMIIQGWGWLAQLIERLLSTPEGPSSIPVLHKLGTRVHTCKPSPRRGGRRIETTEPFSATQEYMRPCLKNRGKKELERWLSREAHTDHVEDLGLSLSTASVTESLGNLTSSSGL